MTELLTRKDAVTYLEKAGLSEKDFENYFRKSGELEGIKEGSRWFFDKKQLDEWIELRDQRTVILGKKEYEECFEFAIKMVYSSKAMGGSIRGARSEMQAADDWILGILAEHGLKKFLAKRYGFDIKLDMEVHPDHITAQDIDKIIKDRREAEPKLNVAVKASKYKNCFLVISDLEYKNSDRRSDVYIFARVGLPSDHLFRILRDHSFFKKVKEFLESSKSAGFRQLLELEPIPIWICGFSYHKELEKVKEIPGQRFENGYRYVKSASKMHNSDAEWKNLIKKL